MKTLITFFVFMLQQGVDFSIQLQPNYASHFVVECEVISYDDAIVVTKRNIMLERVEVSSFGGKDYDIESVFVPLTLNEAKQIIKRSPEAYFISATMAEFEVNKDGVTNTSSWK